MNQVRMLLFQIIDGVPQERYVVRLSYSLRPILYPPEYSVTPAMKDHTDVSVLVAVVQCCLLWKYLRLAQGADAALLFQ